MLIKLFIHVRFSYCFFLILICCLLPLQGNAQKLRLNDYEMKEVYIRMRDGVKLFTAIYSPKDKSRKYPFLMSRTPYSVAPYGADTLRTSLGPSSYLIEDGYTFVYQDVRGRWMSEGSYDNMRPQVSGTHKKKQKEIEEY